MCRMLLLLLLSQIAISIASPSAECDLSKVAIAGGSYTVSDGANTGSKVEYSCPKGMYPHPAMSRECISDGHWTNENEKAVCKAIQCPTPVSIEGGEYVPNALKYFVGDVLTFKCWDGFRMFGPGNHTCQENGKWSGELTICDDQVDQCPNPGIPFGATKVGTSYRIKDKVTYECQNGLKMIGSKERTCMANYHWSGAEPSCRDWYTFDTPEEVAASLSSTLSQIFESADPDKEEDRIDHKLKIKGGLVNIFIIIDASHRLGSGNFETAKIASEIFIEKVSSFDFVPRYAVIPYASSAKPTVRLSDEESVNADDVIEKIKKMEYLGSEDREGANTCAALNAVIKMLVMEEVRDREKFLQTKNVILLMTSGNQNSGENPVVSMKFMRSLMEIRNDNKRDDFLDVYVFGLGDDVSVTELNDIASKKDAERHLFVMENIDSLKRAFQEMIDDAEAFQMCGLSNKPMDDGLADKFPWIAKITITRPGGQAKCKGSIVSRNFILTAAHCFHLDDSLHYITVDIGDGKSQKVKVKNLHRHPKYDRAGKVDKNIRESFDYDLALVELEKPIKFSRTVRPICLPCTTGTWWALRQRGKYVSCRDHEKTLLSRELVKAMFIAEESPRELKEMDVIIKQGSKRNGCLADAKKVPDFMDVVDITDVVTDNFLCTGGIEPDVEPQVCKGDAGGPLIVPFKNRYIQVGVVSWGTVNSCKGTNGLPVPSGSRDFHVNVFRTWDWIKEVVKEDLQFLD
ncbi:complement factor B-like [Mixophyes fleayi]|uniref:complement factor B-like n=1 Tax=Mixophyes fleayi TaxID=3061075 RepID=UPI003F4DF4C6